MLGTKLYDLVLCVSLRSLIGATFESLVGSARRVIPNGIEHTGVPKVIETCMLTSISV